MRFPDRSLSSLKYFPEHILVEQDSRVSRQTSCFLLSISLFISAFSCWMAPSAGLAARSLSLSVIMFLVCSVRPGVKLGILPCGMLRFEAFSRIFRKIISPLSQEDGGGVLLKVCSVSEVKVFQSAFL